MDLTLSNKAMQPISGFAIQLNKNSFGVTPAAPLNVAAPLAPNQSIDVSLSLTTSGPVQRMDPLTNLQVGFWPNAYNECLQSKMNVTVRFLLRHIAALSFIFVEEFIVLFLSPLHRCPPPFSPGQDH